MKKETLLAKVISSKNPLIVPTQVAFPESFENSRDTEQKDKQTEGADKLDSVMKDFAREGEDKNSCFIGDASFESYQLWIGTLKEIDDKSPIFKNAPALLKEAREHLKTSSDDPILFGLFLRLKLNLTEPQLDNFLVNYSQLAGNVYFRYMNASLTTALLEYKISCQPKGNRIYESGGNLFASGLPQCEIGQISVESNKPTLWKGFPSSGLTEMNKDGGCEKPLHLGGFITDSLLEENKLTLEGRNKVTVLKSHIERENTTQRNQLIREKNTLMNSLSNTENKNDDMVRNIRFISKFVDDIKDTNGVWLPGLIEEIEKFNDFLVAHNPTDEQKAAVNHSINLCFAWIKINKQDKLRDFVLAQKVKLPKETFQKLAEFFFVHLEKLKNLEPLDYLGFISLVCKELPEQSRDPAKLTKYLEDLASDCEFLANTGATLKDLFRDKLTRYIANRFDKREYLNGFQSLFNMSFYSRANKLESTQAFIKRLYSIGNTLPLTLKTLQTLQQGNREDGVARIFSRYRPYIPEITEIEQEAIKASVQKPSSLTPK